MDPNASEAREQSCSKIAIAVERIQRGKKMTEDEPLNVFVPGAPKLPIIHGRAKPDLTWEFFQLSFLAAGRLAGWQAASSKAIN